MYNRYISGSGGYTRVMVEEDNRSAEQTQRRAQTQRHGPQNKGNHPLGFLGGEDKNAGIAGILKSFHLEKLDSGDILLLLILLLVFLEGDNIELVITLGLMLLMGLGEENKEGQKE